MSCIMSRRARLPILVLLLIAISVGACASAAPSMDWVAESPAAPVSAPAPSAPYPPEAASARRMELGQVPAERMIISTVQLTIVVDDIDEALSQIDLVTTELGGFVVSMDSSESNGHRVGYTSVRVPSDRLNEAVDRIKDVAQSVRRHSSSAQDVTEEYVDQDARLRNLRATETQYLELLRSATSMEEIITVHRALSEIRDQIERTEGRLLYLRRSSEMATISVNLTTSAAVQALRDREWTLQGTFRQAVQGLIDILLVVSTMAIWVVTLTPIWLPLYFLWRLWRKRRARRSAAAKGSIPPGASDAPSPAT